MKKLLIALAEMFSAFSAKLHDMSEEQGEYVTSWDVRNIIKELPDSLDRKDVIEIVQEAIEDGDINTKQECDEIIYADDIKGLDRYVTDAIDEFDYSDKIDERMFYRMVQELVLTYAQQRGIDTSVIYVHSEEWEMGRYLAERSKLWKKNEADKEQRIAERAIKKYTLEQDKPKPLELGNDTTAVDVKI
jgi:hypothetical protein